MRRAPHGTLDCAVTVSVSPFELGCVFSLGDTRAKSVSEDAGRQGNWQGGCGQSKFVQGRNRKIEGNHPRSLVQNDAHAAERPKSRAGGRLPATGKAATGLGARAVDHPAWPRCPCFLGRREHQAAAKTILSLSKPSESFATRRTRSLLRMACSAPCSLTTSSKA